MDTFYIEICPQIYKKTISWTHFCLFYVCEKKKCVFLRHKTMCYAGNYW